MPNGRQLLNDRHHRACIRSGARTPRTDVTDAGAWERTSASVRQEYTVLEVYQGSSQRR